jgi:hypothetical protein
MKREPAVVFDPTVLGQAGESVDVFEDGGPSR